MYVTIARILSGGVTTYATVSTADPPALPDDAGPAYTAHISDRRPLRVAFYGRVAYDTGTALAAIARQHEICRRALPSGAITATFYDIGSHPTMRRRPGRRLTVGGQPVRRDGGLDGLLAEATRQTRRFDQIIASSLDRLSRRTDQVGELIRHLDRAGVACLFAEDDMRGVIAALPAQMRLRAAEDVDRR